MKLATITINWRAVCAKAPFQRWMRRFALATVAAGAMAALGMLWPMNPAPYLASKGSPQMLDAMGRLLAARPNSEEQWQLPVKLGAVSPWLIEATLAAEDQRFREHWGVDFIAAGRAAWQNLRGGRIVSGASTLTMQLVKWRERNPRTLAGKARQAWQALRLERRADKDALLQAYLNSAPYGMNLVGCEAAARRYFGKPARELTLDEAALLAGLPCSPNSLMPLKHPERARERRDYVLRRMLEDGRIGAAECDRALERPVDAAWREFPFDAPHLAQRALTGAKDGATVRVTLREDVQRMTQDYLKRRVAGLQGEAGNGACIVLDAQSAKALAWCGSVDFFNTPGGGQVDACRAARSPGSTLKPFVYAAAIDRQRLYPTEMLMDARLDFGLYEPENYDGEHHGRVAADEALRESLNVPAVIVLERIGTDAALETLRKMHFGALDQPAEHYGLGLVLGGCETTLENLAGGYAMIAAEGAWRPLRWRADEPAALGARVLHRGVALALFQMLEQPLPGEFTDSSGTLSREPRICWKTGTSANHRDAWCLMFNRRYVVGVWLGNNDGRPSEALNGAGAALPLAAEIFRRLPPGAGTEWPEFQEGLRLTQVCAQSGLPAGPWCRHTREAQLPRELFLNRVCDVHKGATRPNGETYVTEQWPSGARGWDLANVRSRAYALTATANEGERGATDLRIYAPADRGEYVLLGAARERELRPRTSLDDHGIELFWYLDGCFLARSQDGNGPLIALTPGDHRLACMSGDGRMAAVAYRVSTTASRTD
ncbi:penicillin-binding protein 1C [Candidatus Sumerlaeota bacterium]|nr:penicillin-binding protein 1C [Candidatus Sumerlaeota bacterium]